MKIKKELIKREIAGDTILVPVGQTVYDANGLFVMNELAAFIWDLLPRKRFCGNMMCPARMHNRILVNFWISLGVWTSCNERDT